MVEANPSNATNVENPETVRFYERSSGFRVLRDVKNVSECHNNTHLGHPLHYPVLIAQNKSFPTDLLIANTNQKVRVLNMQSGQMTSLDGELHSGPITALHCPEAFASNENLQHVFMTASEDGLVKVWDRRSNCNVASMNSGGGRAPFYSVGTNASLIAAGTNQDVLVWDVHKLNKPIGRFNEGHNEDVTAVKFCPESPNLMVTCSIDNVLNMFDMNNHDASQGPKLKEEDVIDGAYSSTQPMIDCGFVNPEVIWAVTSINTVEFVRVLDAACFMRLTQFPHQVEHLIGVEVVKNASGQQRVLVYGGNILGEVYIYEVANLEQALEQIDHLETIPTAELRLFDMILTQEPYQIRQVTKVGDDTWALCSEKNKVSVLRHDPALKAKQNLAAQAQMLQELEDMEQ